MEKYIVIQMPSIIGLTGEVNYKIEEGYKPQGGVSIHIGYNGIMSNVLYIQAMVLTN